MCSPGHLFLPHFQLIEAFAVLQRSPTLRFIITVNGSYSGRGWSVTVICWAAIINTDNISVFVINILINWWSGQYPVRICCPLLSYSGACGKQLYVADLNQPLYFCLINKQVSSYTQSCVCVCAQWSQQCGPSDVLHGINGSPAMLHCDFSSHIRVVHVVFVLLSCLGSTPSRMFISYSMDVNRALMLVACVCGIHTGSDSSTAAVISSLCLAHSVYIMEGGRHHLKATIYLL